MPDASWTDAVSAYYRSPSVRLRLSEYCGGDSGTPASFSCRNLAGFGGARGLRQADGGPLPGENRDFRALLDDGADVCRSLADRGGTILQLDVDYVNHRDRGEAYRRPDVAFARLEPVYAAIRKTLEDYAAPAAAVMTGCGYHFTLRAPFGSRLHSALVAAAPSAPHGPRRSESGGPAALMVKGHEGAGRVLEHLAHRVVHEARGRVELPVTVADVAPADGGPFICLDLTAYGDPVFERYARCAFSSNQKAAVLQAAPERPFVVVLPRGDRSLGDLLPLREDPAAAACHAVTETGAIPDVDDAPRWIEDYREGAVGRFHREFDEGPQADRSTWSFTYDTVDPQDWPPCIGVPLTIPNPLLLRPVYLRSVALGLWALGWHPRSIAGLIRSKYERDFGWGDLWKKYDPALRAAFYVRVFCAASADGLEASGDFSCDSQAGRGLCEDTACYGEQRELLEWLGETLERLAGR